METLLALLPHEEWKDIIGYEDFYQISNLGRVRFKDRVRILQIKHCFGLRVIIKGKIKQPSMGKYIGYSLSIPLQKQNLFLAHRLVAIHFIPNPENKPQVCHIDDNPRNNVFFNLFWGTASENILDCVKKGRFGCRKRTSQSITNKFIKALGLGHLKLYRNGELVGVFNTRASVAKEIGKDQSLVSKYLKGKTKMPKGIFIEEFFE